MTVRILLWVVALAITVVTVDVVIGADTKPPAVPLPMRTEEPIVYATPINNAVILEFKLYDNRTWCRLYIRREVWKAIRANGGDLPAGADMGQLQCEQR